MSDMILGGYGLVGRALARQLPQAIRYSHQEADITDYQQLVTLFDEQRPKVVYLPAANANVDACEDINSSKVNVAGTLMVLRLCEMFNAKLVWFSSSYVFNGLSKVPYQEHISTDPVQNYGRQKERVEKEMLHGDTPVLIIRTVGVFGDEPENRNFVKSVANSITHRKKVFAPTDQYMNPIFANDLAMVTVGLARHHVGIYHVAGNTCVSKYEFAMQVAEWFGKTRLVEGVTSDKLKQRAPRPRMGCLDCSEIVSVGYTMPNLIVGLTQFLEATYGA